MWMSARPDSTSVAHMPPATTHQAPSSASARTVSEGARGTSANVSMEQIETLHHSAQEHCLCGLSFLRHWLKFYLQLSLSRQEDNAVV